MGSSLRAREQSRPVDIGRRVVVVGPSGSGKNTVAERIAAHLGVPCIDLDALHWEPGWHGGDGAVSHGGALDVFRARLQSALVAPEALKGWVIAGNYFAEVRPLAWELADTIVWLDLPLQVTVPRLLMRSWRRSRSRTLLWGTNRERFWPQLMLWSPPQSLIAYNIRRHGSRRRELLDAMRSPRWRRQRWVHIRATRGVDTLLRDLA